MQVTEAMRAEVSAIRDASVNTIVSRKIDRRDGDASAQQITTWEAAALTNWGQTYPALASILKEN